MKHLNIKATEIFCRLMDSLGRNILLDFQLDDNSKLVLDVIEYKIEASRGTGKLFSMSRIDTPDHHQYTLMKFIVIDGRTSPYNFNQVLIYPASYLQRDINVDETSILIKNGEVVNCKNGQQSIHCKTANQWMRNISQQSFFKMQFPNALNINQNNFYMQPLQQMTNEEKANLIFRLCPDVSRGFLGFVLTVATGNINQTDDELLKWENESIHDLRKIVIATEVKRKIESQFNKMVEVAAVLAAELFDNVHYPFLLHCLQQYTVAARNERFNRGIEFIFDI